MSHPPVATTVDALRAHVASWRRAGERVALVPTMGALHAGHLSLVEAAAARADRVVVSIFVNPAQFAPTEDLATYPRDLDADLGALATTATGLVFAPDAAEMYPEGEATVVSVGGPARGLESDARPHFFAGVATVVTKLLVQCAPDVAIFGDKDFQQLAVIRRLVRDLALPVEIVGQAILREPDGLAMSSRNVYLTGDVRERAAWLYRTLATAATGLAAGDSIGKRLDAARAELEAHGFMVDYVELRDAATLGPVGSIARPARLLAAARIGGVRLIDNLAVPLAHDVVSPGS